MSVRRKLIVVFTFLVSAMCNAQEQKPFEGELHYRSVGNNDKTSESMGLGMLYNGENNTTCFIKGNKILSFDEGRQVYTLCDVDNDLQVVYSTLIKKGYKQTGMFSNYSVNKEGISIDGKLAVANSLHRFEKKEDAQFMGMRVEHLVGRIETSNLELGQEVDIYVLPSIYVPKAANLGASSFDVGFSGLVCKYRVTTTAKPTDISGVPKWMMKKLNKSVDKKLSKMAGGKIDSSIDMKSYTYFELKEIKERIIDDSEFSIPDDVQIRDLGEFGNTKKKLKDLQAVVDWMNQFNKEQSEYLMQHNIHPKQVKLDVVYEIDQEWDF